MQGKSQQDTSGQAPHGQRFFKHSLRSYTGTDATPASIKRAEGTSEYPEKAVRRSHTEVSGNGFDFLNGSENPRGHRTSLRTDGPDLSTRSSHSSLRSIFKGKGHSDNTGSNNSNNPTNQGSSLRSISGHSIASASSSSSTPSHHSLAPVQALSRLKNTVIHHHRKHNHSHRNSHPPPNSQAETSNASSQTASHSSTGTSTPKSM